MTSGAAGVEQRLWRHEEPEVFGATVLAAAEQLDVQPLAVQKDYWVCQALRAVVAAFPAQIIFKGGTSLEKLRLIQRFSEDLDLLVVADFPNERQGKKRLKEMCQVAAEAWRAIWPTRRVAADSALFGVRHTSRFRWLRLNRRSQAWPRQTVCSSSSDSPVGDIRPNRCS